MAEPPPTFIAPPEAAESALPAVGGTDFVTVAAEPVATVPAAGAAADVTLAVLRHPDDPLRRFLSVGGAAGGAIEFNPAHVVAYRRLPGDGGVFELVPAGLSPADVAGEVDELRRRAADADGDLPQRRLTAEAAEARAEALEAAAAPPPALKYQAARAPAHADELLTLTAGGTLTPLPADAATPPDQADPAARLAVAAAALAMIERGAADPPLTPDQIRALIGDPADPAGDALLNRLQQIRDSEETTP